jgi:phospholipid/cholesterol/gamma-HCH transport system permease protein
MQINNELEALELVGVDPVEFEFMPRIVGGTLAVVGLTAVGIVIALALVYLVIEGIQPWSLPPGDFGNVLGKVFGIPALLVLWLKAIAFGLAVTVIPITAGVATPKRLAFAPISVLRGMVRLFVAIMLIEGLTLVAGRVV